MITLRGQILVTRTDDDLPSPSLRVYVQNVTVGTGTTPTCVSTCARGAGTHGDVLTFSVCSVRSVFSLLVFVFSLVSFFVFHIVSSDVSCFLLCLCLFSLCFHGFPVKKCHMCSPFSLLVVSAVLLVVPFHLELHLAKLIAAYYKHNPLITYKMGLFRPRIL